MQLYRLTFPPIAGPFTLEHLRDSDRWAAELVAWSRGERPDPPAGLVPLAMQEPGRVSLRGPPLTPHHRD